jgi:acetyl esterase/lipase
MDTLFFLTSLAIGWLAWNVNHPILTHPKLNVLSFIAGWLTGELALHVIFWQMITVAFFILFYSVDGFFGAIGFLICAASWASLAHNYYRSAESDKAVEASLMSSLGENYESGINEDIRAAFPAKPDLNLIRHPFIQRDPDVEMIRDLPFGNHGQSLDIRRARGSSEDTSKPVLLQIHGGAWTEHYGSKRDQGIPLMNHMAKRGWVCVSSSYRLSPTATFPDHIVDCKEAVVWIKDHIADYGGNPDFIVVTGGSAGGHLSSLIALSPNHEPFQPGFPDRDTTVQGAVPFYGVYDFTDTHGLHHHEGATEYIEDYIFKLDMDGNEAIFQEASPYFHISESAPPFMVIHGDKDSLVPVACGRVFAEELSRVSANPVAYLELAGAQHAFDVFPSMRSEHVKHGVEKFLGWTYSQYLKSD